MFDSVTEIMLCSLNHIFFPPGYPERLHFPVFTAVTWVILLSSHPGNEDRSDVSHFFYLSSKTLQVILQAVSSLTSPVDAEDPMEDYKAPENCKASRLEIRTLVVGHGPFWFLNDRDKSLPHMCLPSHPGSPTLDCDMVF